MDWKLLFIFVFTLMAGQTHAADGRVFVFQTEGKQTLQLRGVVPLRVGVGLVKNSEGNLIPTLRTNEPASSSPGRSLRMTTVRSPASTGDIETVTIQAQ